MFIVDSQVHIWAADSPERPWPPILHPGQSRPHRPEPITKDDMLREMDGAGVHRALIAPPVWEGVRNDIALAAAREHPDRFAVMGRVDLNDPASRELIPTWRAQPGMLGLRYAFHRPTVRPLLVERRLEWLWASAEAAGVPIMMFPLPEDIHLMEEIAVQHPALKLTIDHMGFVGKGEAAFRGFDKALALAARPNIAMKVSSLPLYANDPYPYRSLHSYVRHAYDAYGPQRLFWGSDLSRLSCPYREAVTMFTEEMPWFSREDLEWIMGRGVCSWTGWSTGRS